jgi:hypothetical protein
LSFVALIERSEIRVFVFVFLFAFFRPRRSPGFAALHPGYVRAAVHLANAPPPVLFVFSPGAGAARHRLRIPALKGK